MSSSSNVLAARDINTAMPAQAGAETNANTKPDVMSMEYHRQVFQSKMNQSEYVASPLQAHPQREQKKSRKNEDPSRESLR